MANINKIRISGTSYDIQDSNATKVVDITQAQYNALPASAKTANVLYNITDAEAVDFSQYWTSAETQSAITEATSGKVSTSDFNTYSGSVDTALNSKASQTDLSTLSGTVTAHTADTAIHVTAQDKTNWNNKSDFSGSYNDLTDKPTIPTVPTNVSDFTNDAGYITSSALDDYATTATTSAINNTLTGHTADTTIHVSAEQIAAWNAKSDFSGSYDDLTDKPTIPTSTSQLTNDSGYITSSALNGYATTGDVQTATNDMATKTWVGQQGYLTQHQDISGKQDVSGMTAYTETTAFTAHTADTTIHVTTAQTAAWNAKSDFSGSYNDLTNKLSAGTNVTIVDNVISATGGGGGMTEDDELLLSTALVDLNERKIDASEVKSQLGNYQKKGDYVTTNTLNTRLAEYETALDEQNVEEVTAYALNDLNERFGGLKIVKISETEYQSLSVKDQDTLYVVIPDPS